MRRLLPCLLLVGCTARAPSSEDAAAALHDKGFYNIEFVREDAAGFHFTAEEMGCWCTVRAEPIADGFALHDMCLD